MQPVIRIQREDFSLAHEYERLAADAGSGAVVTFVGKVRDVNQGEAVAGLSLEHYPGMTEKALAEIVAEAARRWPLLDCTVIHRIGDLLLAEQIVLVAVSSAHREAAFAACHFIMDFLKTRAPFWKRELTTDGRHYWVEARHSDNQAADRWQAASSTGSESDSSKE
ncbi:molybdopterin synthase subunit MoaE [Aeromonas sp. RU39B]|uniref:molybdopterin synthase catalytic subunit MoaE n=1 Tax=Aeromonas sp. RU39B TaxID=1907416 RepID=UPI00095428AC|nr:molybdopterin synthase catalytic subunit MoaE [Aeromonas sp. RU39B]SIQ15147.1 molybdopterin synthase subunit MoaE [Aeromonas sp. RU39B]